MGDRGYVYYCTRFIDCNVVCCVIIGCAAYVFGMYFAIFGKRDSFFGKGLDYFFVFGAEEFFLIALELFDFAHVYAGAASEVLRIPFKSSACCFALLP